MSEILKKLEQVQQEMPANPASPSGSAMASAAPEAPAGRTGPAKRNLSIGFSSLLLRIRSLWKRRPQTSVEFRSRQLAGRLMSAARNRLGGAARRPTRTKSLLVGSFAAGLGLFILVLFFSPTTQRKRSGARTPTTAVAVQKKTQESSNRAPAMAPAAPKAPIANSAAPSEKELQMIQAAEGQVRVGKVDAAIAQLERETGTNPFLTRALFSLATYYQKKNQLDKATATLMRILQVEPKNPLAYNNLGMIQLRLKRIKEAVIFLEKACENAPETADPWLNMAIAYEQKLRWSDSVRAYEKYSQLMSSHQAKASRSLADEKVLAAVNIRLTRLRAFSAADDRQIASISEVEEEDSEEAEDPRTAPETQPADSQEEVDPKPLVQPAREGKATLAPPQPAPSQGKSR